MSYEIPKEVKYQEKILFNLNFEQALWTGLFGILVFIIFTKIPLSLEARALMSLVLIGLGIGFAFFDFRQRVTHLFGFLFSPRKIGYLDSKMRKFVSISKIEDDVIYLQNGTMKAVIHVQPINFHILSQKQKEAIISAYKDFLNSLDFPIQIVMRTVNLNIDDYLKNLEVKVRGRKKEHLTNQFLDFEDFMRKYIEENSVRNRLFYIIIPYVPSKKILGKNSNSLESLNIRVKLCQEKLLKCNLSTKRLSTNELVSLLSSYFEGFVEAKNEYQSLITQLKEEEK
jgi:hypothetical protein